MNLVDVLAIVLILTIFGGPLLGWLYQATFEEPLRHFPQGPRRPLVLRAVRNMLGAVLGFEILRTLGSYLFGSKPLPSSVWAVIVQYAQNAIPDLVIFLAALLAMRLIVLGWRRLLQALRNRARRRAHAHAL